MPKVGKKKYPYTPKGRAAAKKAAPNPRTAATRAKQREIVKTLGTLGPPQEYYNTQETRAAEAARKKPAVTKAAKKKIVSADAKKQREAKAKAKKKTAAKTAAKRKIVSADAARQRAGKTPIDPGLRKSVEAARQRALAAKKKHETGVGIGESARADQRQKELKKELREVNDQIHQRDLAARAKRRRDNPPPY